ncbi:MAG: ATPase, T2SS/T4P/T4SS family [Candidatus Omnitrophota bacterium]
MIKSLKQRLIEVLVESNLLTQEQLDNALHVQQESGRRLSEILTKLGYISDEHLLVALSRSLNIPPINLSRFKIEQDVVKLIPQEVAKRYQLIPVSKIGNFLTMAMADPLNIFAIDDIKALTHFNLKVVIASENDITLAIEKNYEEPARENILDAIQDVKDMHIEVINEQIQKKEDTNVGRLIRMQEETPVIKVTNLILSDAITKHASDILIEPQEKSMRVRYRVDGILQDAEAPPLSMHEAIVSRIKVMSSLNIAEHRLPQDGRFKVKIAQREVDFRVSILPASSGEKLALRILDKDLLLLDIEKLGFAPDALANIKEAALQPHGMIVICGPTGCGKTTTLYSILNFVDSPDKNIITVEDPVEYQIYGINQVTVHQDIGLTFASSLRSILRQDPDVIMIGEIRDLDTVDIAIKSALTGHLVLSTLHTTDAVGTIVRLVNMGVEPFLITSACLLFGAQRLMRCLCPHCKERYTINDTVAQRLNLSKDKREFYRSKGCSACNGTGYKGRVGIIETLVMDYKIKELIMAKKTEYEIKKSAIAQGMVTLREHGIDKAFSGLTSLEEVLRLTADK